jgi:glyoxylase-like metal-dependent hydrolase (beta-lactamase superfamily II)
MSSTDTKSCDQTKEGESMANWLTDSILQLDSDYPSVADFPLWLYVVRGTDRSAVIDTGVASTYSAIAGMQLTDAGLSPEEVTVIMNTHGHPDHFGGNASWRAASPEAIVCAPLADAPWVEDHDRHWKELWNGFPGCLSFDATMKEAILNEYCGANTEVAVALRDADTVDLGDRELLAVRTGGHSPDHMAYFDSSDRVLFCGDVVQAAGQPFLTSGAMLAPLYHDPAEYRIGLCRLLALDFSWLVPSHSQPLGAAEGRSLIERSLTFVDRVDDVIDSQIAARGTLLTARVAEEIGRLTGNGVTLQTAAVATAHLRERAAAGQLDASWSTVE